MVVCKNYQSQTLRLQGFVQLTLSSAGKGRGLFAPFWFFICYSIKLYETSFDDKKFATVLLFSCDSPFVLMSAWQIVGHFLPIFNSFSSKLLDITKSSLKIVFFCHFEYFFTFLVQNSDQGNFQFSDIFGRFHEYTLNMAPYYVTEEFNGYF